MSADLKLVISADVAVATKQVKEFSKEVEEMGKDATAAAVGMEKLNPATSRVQTNLAKTAVAAAKVDSSLAKAATGTNTAANALTNLGRVAQDAPFGFIGIQNNLNPLLESFTRLRQETGSTGTALKALGASLMGPAGIGIALSVVSSAILLYQEYTRSAKKETLEQAEAIKIVVTSYERFLAELEKTTETLGKEAAKVSILFSALSDSNVPLRERKGILEQLNQISPGYLGNLDKESASYTEIAAAVNAYSDSLAKSAEIKALLPQVEAIYQKLIKAQVELNQLRRFGTDDENFFGLSASDFKKEEQRITSVINNLANQIKIAKAGLTSFAGGELELSEILFGKTPELEQAKKIKEKILKPFRKIKFTPEDFAFFADDEIRLKLPAFVELDFVKGLRDKQGDNPLSNIYSPQELSEAKMQAELIGMGITKGIQDGINVGVTALRLPELSELYKSSKSTLEAFGNAATQVAQNTIANIFTGIAESIGSGEGIFGGFLKILGNGLKSLGAYMISISKIIAGIKIAMKSLNPALLLIGGLALVAIGAALSSVKVPGFADGVTNFSGGMAIVGERGPELVRLPKGSDVIPNGQIGNMSAGGMAINVYGRIEAQGSTLVTIIDRAERRISRNG